MKNSNRARSIIALVFLFLCNSLNLSHELSEYRSDTSGTSFNKITFTGPVNFGWPVSEAGDLNADGYDDFIVSGQQSLISVFFGSENIDTIADVLIALDGKFSGPAVSEAGDVNGDGYDDIIIGLSNNGDIAYIFLGGVQMDSIADVVLIETSKLSTFGSTVSTAGDVNGDGYSDVIVGNHLEMKAYIYFGGPEMNNVADIILVDRSPRSSEFGDRVSDAGVVNGDGYSDVIVGAPLHDDGYGRAYIYFGGSAMDTASDIVLTGLTSSDGFGYEVSCAGDINRDGFSDVIVGAIIYNSFTGRAYIFLGGLAMNNTADVILKGSSPENYFGYTLDGVDINGDGYSDVIVGGRYENFANIYKGGVSMDSTVDFIFTGIGYFGQSVSGAGDINGDGNSDFLVGAPFEGSGRTYLYLSLRIKLIMNAFLQGFYDPVSNNQVEDTIKAYLRNSSSPYEIVDSDKSILSSNGIDTIKFGNAPPGNYYIVVGHRNSIETWSRSGGESLTPGTTSYYDYTNSISQAFGNNLTLKGSKYCIYSGDVNQDGVVDGTDTQLIDNDVYNFVIGYVRTDIDGNNFVDGSDAIISDNNAFNFVSVIGP